MPGKSEFAVVNGAGEAGARIAGAEGGLLRKHVDMGPGSVVLAGIGKNDIKGTEPVPNLPEMPAITAVSAEIDLRPVSGAYGEAAPEGMVSQKAASGKVARRGEDNTDSSIFMLPSPIQPGDWRGNAPAFQMGFYAKPADYLIIAEGVQRLAIQMIPMVMAYAQKINLGEILGSPWLAARPGGDSERNRGGAAGERRVKANDPAVELEE